MRQTKNNSVILATIFFALISHSFAALASTSRCEHFLSKKSASTSRHSRSEISGNELVSRVAEKITQVSEFHFIRETAQSMGLRVWLFGGTAASFLHYVKWDLARSKGLIDLQIDRFDFEFTNIFRSTQDLDIVVDATPEVAWQFQNTIVEKFPHFLGSKANKWEVRTLRHRIGTPGQLGFKEALLDDTDFNQQNTDSNSIGMVEVTGSSDPIVRDLKNWNQKESIFLEDTVSNEISYFRSDRHFTTVRAKAGENPEILSVLRLLVKAFQYELTFSGSTFHEMKEIAEKFNPASVNNSVAQRRIQETAKKLIIHAVNIEYAVNKLDELGLRQKLIKMGNSSEQESFAWWLNREPLRSKAIGEGHGKTAAELDIQVVAHETNSLLAYESITRAHSGEPNVLISRQNEVGEAAADGDGFYTRLGAVGARGTGLTIRFGVDPKAREGTDFIMNGEVIVFKNKRVLKIIPESFDFGFDDLIRIAESNQEVQVDKSDFGLLEKLQRRLNTTRITDELDKLLSSKKDEDFNKLVQLLGAFQDSSVSKLISEDVIASVAKNIYGRVSQMAQSSKEPDILKYIRAVGPILQMVDSAGLLKHQDFIQYLKKISSGEASFELRREAIFEMFLNVDSFERFQNFGRNLSSEELKTVVQEIRKWHRSSDARKRMFAVELNSIWSDAIKSGDVIRIQTLTDANFFDINHRNISEVSILQLAAYFKKRDIIEWLVSNPEFDFTSKNTHGFTEVEQLRLSGRGEIADAIEEARPEARGQKFQATERNLSNRTKEYPEGTPIVDFVRIEPGSYMKGDNYSTILTTITKPFEFMSVDVTQEVYRRIVELINVNLLPEEYNVLEASPSHFKGNNLPVEQVSYNDITLWKKGLNELSKLDDHKVQEQLKEIFPGHRRGHEYGLPTEGQWELVGRLGGVAEEEYPHRWSYENLEEYVIYTGNSESKTWPVGYKKPVFYNGKPIYDLIGNVSKWIEDYWWNDSYLSGGIDPVGPRVGSHHVVVGGHWGYNFASSLAGMRGGFEPNTRLNRLGFRLMRTISNP